MDRGLLSIYATTSGMEFAGRICLALTRHMNERATMISQEDETADLSEEMEMITLTRAFNRKHFGTKDFCVRVTHRERFASREIKAEIPRYNLEEEGNMVSNSVRKDDGFLVHTAQPITKNIDDILEGEDDMIPKKRVKELIKEGMDQPNIHELLFEMLQTSYTHRRWGNRMTLVCPDQIYTRQDHARGREETTAKLLAKLIETARVDSCIYMDLHSKQIPGFYDHSPENLQVQTILMRAFAEQLGIKGNENESFVFGSPDASGAPRARLYAEILGAGTAVGLKIRNYDISNVVEKSELIGKVRDKKVILVDDMIDTAGSMTKIVEKLMELGATEVYLASTHGIYSTPAVDRLDRLYESGLIKGVFDIGTIPKPQWFKDKHQWLIELDPSQVFAETIYNMNFGISVAHVYMDSSKTPVYSYKNGPVPVRIETK